jgi:hypothetical protein
LEISRSTQEHCQNRRAERPLSGNPVHDFLRALDGEACAAPPSAGAIHQLSM